MHLAILVTVIFGVYVISGNAIRKRRQTEYIEWRIIVKTGAIRGINAKDFHIRLKFKNEVYTKWKRLDSDHADNFVADHVDIFHETFKDIDYPPIGIEVKTSETLLVEKIELIHITSGFRKGDNFTAPIYHRFDDETIYYPFTSPFTEPRSRWKIKVYVANVKEAATNANILVQLRRGRVWSNMFPLHAHDGGFTPGAVAEFEVMVDFWKYEALSHIKVCLDNTGRLDYTLPNFLFTKITAEQPWLKQSTEHVFFNDKWLPTNDYDRCLLLCNEFYDCSPDPDPVLHPDTKKPTSTLPTTPHIISTSGGGSTIVADDITTSNPNGTLTRPETAEALEDIPDEAGYGLWVVVIGCLAAAGFLFGVAAQKRINSQRDADADDAQNDQTEEKGAQEDQDAENDENAENAENDETAENDDNAEYDIP